MFLGKKIALLTLIILIFTSLLVGCDWNRSLNSSYTKALEKSIKNNYKDVKSINASIGETTFYIKITTKEKMSKEDMDKIFEECKKFTEEKNLQQALSSNYSVNNYCISFGRPGENILDCTYFKDSKISPNWNYNGTRGKEIIDLGP